MTSKILPWRNTPLVENKIFTCKSWTRCGLSTDGKFDSDFGFTRLGTVFTNILSADVLDDEFSVGTIGDGFVFQDAENAIQNLPLKEILPEVGRVDFLWSLEPFAFSRGVLHDTFEDFDTSILAVDRFWAGSESVGVFGSSDHHLWGTLGKHYHMVHNIWSLEKNVTYHGQQPWQRLERFPFLVQPWLWEQR